MNLKKSLTTLAMMAAAASFPALAQDPFGRQTDAFGRPNMWPDAATTERLIRDQPAIKCVADFTPYGGRPVEVRIEHVAPDHMRAVIDGVPTNVELVPVDLPRGRIFDLTGKWDTLLVQRGGGRFVRVSGAGAPCV